MPGKVSDANNCKIPTNPHHDAADVKFIDEDGNPTEMILKHGSLGHNNDLFRKNPECLNHCTLRRVHCFSLSSSSQSNRQQMGLQMQMLKAVVKTKWQSLQVLLVTASTGKKLQLSHPALRREVQLYNLTFVKPLGCVSSISFPKLFPKLAVHYIHCLEVLGKANWLQLKMLDKCFTFGQTISFFDDFKLILSNGKERFLIPQSYGLFCWNLACRPFMHSLNSLFSKFASSNY